MKFWTKLKWWLTPAKDTRVVFLLVISGVVMASSYEWFIRYGVSIILVLIAGYYHRKWFVERTLVAKVEKDRVVHYQDVADQMRNAFYDEGIVSKVECDTLVDAAMTIIKREM